MYVGMQPWRIRISILYRSTAHYKKTKTKESATKSYTYVMIYDVSLFSLY